MPLSAALVLAGAGRTTSLGLSLLPFLLPSNPQSSTEYFKNGNYTDILLKPTLTRPQGVPALFRWLSKKYPKIVERVKEDTPKKIRGPDGEIVEEPIRYENPNPNGFEVDNLYRKLIVVGMPDGPLMKIDQWI